MKATTTTNQVSTINLNYTHPDSPHECGYCKDPKGSITMGFTSDYLKLSHYKSLMDRGWRKCSILVFCCVFGSSILHYKTTSYKNTPVVLVTRGLAV